MISKYCNKKEFCVDSETVLDSHARKTTRYYVKNYMRPQEDTYYIENEDTKHKREENVQPIDMSYDI